MLGNWVSNGQSWSTWNSRDVFPQKFSVAKSSPSRAIDPDNVLVELTHLKHNTCFIPFQWVRACLVLDADVVANFQWRGPLCVLSPVLGHSHMTVPECFLALCEGASPSGMGVVFPWQDGDEILNGPSEDTHSWRNFGFFIRGIPVLKDGALKGVDVQVSCGPSFVGEESFRYFNANLCPTIRMGKIG